MEVLRVARLHVSAFDRPPRGFTEIRAIGDPRFERPKVIDRRYRASASPDIFLPHWTKHFRGVGVPSETFMDHACPRCGAPVPEGASAGTLCAACAELTVQEEMATLQVASGEPVAGSPVPADLAGETETIGDYEILGKLGQGGMGAVFRARQISLDRLVALKLLPSHLEDDDHFVSRFQREAAVAASLNHPNLVRVYASGQADGTHFIAMELVEGENLRQRLKRGQLLVQEAVRICLDVARALQCGWQRAQLIHRDVKPSNIYLSASGQVKLGDLGLAKSLLSNTTGLTHTGSAIGTPHYISPEQARGDKTIDFRADIYSLGCTLYELLTSTTPYFGTDPMLVMNMHVNAPPPAILKVFPQCPLPLARLVSKMLRKARHERPQTYEELTAALEQVQQQLEQGPTVASPLLAAWREIGAAEQRGFVARKANDTPGELPTNATKTSSFHPKILWAGISTGLLLLGVCLFIILRVRPAPSASHRSPAKNVASPSSIITNSQGGRPADLEPWQDVWSNSTDIILSGLAMRTPDGLQFPNGGARLARVPETQRNGAIRLRTVFGNAHPELRVRLKTASSGYYRVTVWDARTVRLGFINSSSQAETQKFPIFPSLEFGQEFELELRVIGQKLTAKVNGKLVGTLTDSTLTEGSFAVGLGGPHKELTMVIVKSLEFLDLDAAASSNAQKATNISATATKEAPFTNALGMKFVPVPITGGLTDGQRVLFSIWETRVQDYEVFAKETKRDWPKAKFEQTPQHPAVNVSWDDAQAFCQWLNKREHRIGSISADESYRLPSDHEWSCAVGIGDQDDASLSPKANGELGSSIYPWGAGWPPPPGSGNFGGSERPLRTGESAKSPNGEELVGYRDDFIDTAPVGSCAGNSAGLFDLSGNVTEWCEDPFYGRNATAQRTRRGGSFGYRWSRDLLSSHRSSANAQDQSASTGFRVVLAPTVPP